METLEFSWLSNLPSEILIEILGQLDVFQLNQLICVNKYFQTLSQYALDNQKKIRLCGDHSRVLVLSFPSQYDQISCSEPEADPTSGSRALYLVGTFFEEAPVKEIYWVNLNTFDWAVYEDDGGKERMITFIRPTSTNLRVKLYSLAATAHLCVLIVDPNEVDTHAEELKEMIFGCCFMMSARNIIVVVDLSNAEDKDAVGLSSVFEQSKIKITKLLRLSSRHRIIPINVRTGSNVIPDIQPKYDWFKGASLKQLVLEDQLRTYFDEEAYNELYHMQLRLDISNFLRIGRRIIIKGPVIRGTVKWGERLFTHPWKMKGHVHSIQRCWQNLQEAKPGDFVGIHLENPSNVPLKELYTNSIMLGLESVSYTKAFRAQIMVRKPDRFAQRQVYKILYGHARIPCLLWWIFPTDEDPDSKTRKFKIERSNWPVKPVNNQISDEEYQKLLKKYKIDLAQAKEQFAKFQKECGSGFVRPPRKQFKKVTAILLPLIQYDIEPYKPSEFEKNHSGKLLIMEKNSIIAVGRVDRVICERTRTFKIPNRKDLEFQIQLVVRDAQLLFILPQELKLLKLFTEYASNKKHTKLPVHKEKGPTDWKQRWQRYRSQMRD